MRSFYSLALTLRRPPVDGAHQIRQTPPGRIPSFLDLTQVDAVTAAIRAAITRGARPIPSLGPRQSDLSGDDDDDESGHPTDQHLWYPPIQSLQVGDARLFVSGSTERLRELVRRLPDPTLRWSAVRDALEDDGLYRLSDVLENPWILKAGTDTFTGPCELTNESTMIWVTKLKTTTKLVHLSKQEIYEQNWESCEELKEECFAEVAGQCLQQLLVVACSFSDARWSDGHISQQLTVFDAIVDVLFNIQDLHFNRSGEIAGIANKMVNAFEGVILGTSNDIHGSNESTIHPATDVLIQVLDFFRRNRDMVQPILESGGYNTDPCFDMFNYWLSKLKESAEIMFVEKGQRQYIKSYLDECWVALLIYLDGEYLKKLRRASLDKFTEEFFSICDRQMTWKVRTELKMEMRKEIVKLIVPKYGNFFKALLANPSPRWPSRFKVMWPAKSQKPVYTDRQLEQIIMELFER
ncbi:uncharacterized protein LOC100826506 isoform X2 [Brachypodium distachyon]|uniref:Exocyst subunit Exo70 family protein n=1 Tax=Brachypodium distachyon TaxID=15368 RepID=A0A0Q3H0S2_BRADI|nr:uncharacterized protein LOC100826506 isoform X2 [Brachypodium distachyon]KQJ81635.1 hypothetical protein BRADI_5g01926v3 [Brachypodium distachyon]|eukprot:XP_010239660.1 uncharacterized protein LOC100826506 isoform X2 [Brachypodium distachyon]